MRKRPRASLPPKTRTSKDRGRSVGASTPFEPSPTRPNYPIERNVEATRPIGRGGTVHRGDRRDTNPKFTNNNRHQENNCDPLGSGKKQIQAGGKAFKKSGTNRR